MLNFGNFEQQKINESAVGQAFSDFFWARRNFLYFCGTSNVVAVRWLLRFGASAYAHDSNNTTGLHVPCNSELRNTRQKGELETNLKEAFHFSPRSFCAGCLQRWFNNCSARALEVAPLEFPLSWEETWCSCTLMLFVKWVFHQGTPWDTIRLWSWERIRIDFEHLHHSFVWKRSKAGPLPSCSSQLAPEWLTDVG